MGNMPIHILGDSHAVYFKAAAEAGRLGRRRASYCIVPGATAAGMRNPNSMTDALSRFRASLAWTGPRTLHVIQLGEVDCGFVIWLRAATARGWGRSSTPRSRPTPRSCARRRRWAAAAS